MESTSYLCSVLVACAPVLGLCFFVSVITYSTCRNPALNDTATAICDKMRLAVDPGARIWELP